jgi:hypothetical protein
MPRALIAEWSEVSPRDLAAAQAAWHRRRDGLTEAGCHYWVFESPDEPGRYLEFIEARDAAQLLAGLRHAGLGGRAPTVLTEVELT